MWAGLKWQIDGNDANAVSDFRSAINLGFHHWRVSWYLAKSAEKSDDNILAKKSLKNLLQAAPEFNDAQKMNQRIGDIETEKENGTEKFSIQCPHCGAMLDIDRHSTWHCPCCKKDFVV